MSTKKSVDYLQVMRDFDRNLGRKSEDFDVPLKDSILPDGGVDYLKVSREYGNYCEKGQSETIADVMNTNR